MTRSAATSDVRRRIGDRRHAYPRAGRRSLGGSAGGSRGADHVAYRCLRSCARHLSQRQASVDQASRDVGQFIAIAGVAVVPVTDRETETALDAFWRYGKGRGHPAQLNLGDCFAYAMAKNHRKRLLFTGDDFDRTDIESAMDIE